MDYLDRKDCERSDSEVALDRLEKLGLVDDKHFAEVWVADRQAVRPRSKQRLAQELAAKGIDRLVIDEVLNDIDPEREVLALKDLIVRKQKLSGYSDERKLLGYLQRQGYRWGLIKEALLQIKNEG
jgi:regulatory protein